MQSSALRPSRLPAVSRLASLLESRDLLRNPVGVFQRHTARIGKSFVFHFGGITPAIVSSDAEVLQHVLKTNQENYRKSEIQMKRIHRFLGTGLLTTHGEPWRIQRRIIQQGFTTAKLSAMTSKMRECLDQSLQQFERRIEAGPVDIYPEMMRFTFRIVSRAIFSSALSDDEVEHISGTISLVQRFIVRQVVQPYLNPWFALSGEFRRHEEMRDEARRIVLGQIRERRAHPGGYDDLLQILLDAVYHDTGEGMSDEVILNETVQLLLAGHETSSDALSWTLYLLASEPSRIAAIRREYESVVGPAGLQFGDVSRLTLTSQIVEESLRLYPPFWVLDRVAVADDVIGRLPIRGGTLLMLFVYGSHHSPEYWDEPEQFKPERFSGEERRRHTPFAYLPFGGGPRGCLGWQFAMLQMLMILGTLLGRYDVALTPNQEIVPWPGVFLKPKNGIRMTFSRRRQPVANAADIAGVA